ncbi:hypothetical protein SG34_030255 [Thalassomonas viridans]|uniref:Uncharacterized protein n=1 Tax=Thalassomonas viridans TaxID=137584 RepID=A0AAF0CE72_9GAMM|nr:hypothetical protein [Thalassomonas viridans]WDE09060.1 hypothetical protein SG34_030255 [Thalassomonas viridans]
MRESKKAICVTNKIKTPTREQDFIFSHPINLYLNRLLYQHKEQPQLNSSVLNAKGELVSLNRLFQEYSDKLIIISGSLSYGNFLDEQIAAISSDNKMILDGSNPYDRAYYMFSLKRGDFLLAYPAEMYRHYHKDSKHYQAYRVSGAPKYVLGHLMCNNTRASVAFLKSVNNVLNKLYRQQDFISAHTQWLPQTAHELTLDYLGELTGQPPSAEPK